MSYQKKYSKENKNLPLFSKIMVGFTVKIKDIENKAFKNCMMHEIAVCFWVVLPDTCRRRKLGGT